MKVAENIVSVLRMLVRSTQDISVAEVARHIGLNRSSASRLLATLRDGGLVEQSPTTHKYRPGVLALQLGMRSKTSFDVLEWVTAQSETIVQKTGHTVCIGVLEKNDLTIVATRRRPTPIYLALNVGTTIHAHASAMGKVILAQMSDTEVRATLPEELEKLASGTKDNIDDLLTDLKPIRSNGYAISHNELSEGIASYAVAVELRKNLTVAVGVAFFTNEQHSDEYTIISALLEFKKVVSDNLSLTNEYRDE